MHGENHNFKRYLHLSIHCSTIYNNQDMEATRCLPTEDWIKKTWYIYTMGCYLAIKRNRIMPSTQMWMDPETVIQSKVKSVKEKQVSYTDVYIWNLEKWYID